VFSDCSLAPGEERKEGAETTVSFSGAMGKGDPRIEPSKTSERRREKGGGEKSGTIPRAFAKKGLRREKGIKAGGGVKKKGGFFGLAK